MKNHFLKNVLSLATIVLAIGGSFVSHASQKSPKAIIPGYATTNPARRCAHTVACSTDAANPYCTYTTGTTTYYALGRLTPNVYIPCEVILYKVTP